MGLHPVGFGPGKARRHVWRGSYQPGGQDPGCNRTKHATAGMASKSVQRRTIQGSQSGGHVHGLARCTGSGWKADETVPAQQNTKDETVAMVVTGLSAPPGYAPGPYGNFGAAKSRTMRTLRTDDDGF